jgi:hypothetical protein
MFLFTKVSTFAVLIFTFAVVYRDQPASSASPPTRDKIQSEEKVRTRRVANREKRGVKNARSFSEDFSGMLPTWANHNKAESASMCLSLQYICINLDNICNCTDYWISVVVDCGPLKQQYIFYGWILCLRVYSTHKSLQV